MQPLRVGNRTVRSGEVSLAVAEAGLASRPTIVMIHGYPDTKEVWGPVMERLSGDFHLVAYDVRGAGGSSAPGRTRDYELARLADDFAAVRAAVSPERPVHLVGHDWGGIQAWEFVCDPRFAGAIASFTTIAGPALGHAVRATRGPLRAGQVARAAGRMRRSWYIVPLCLPGGPRLAWDGLITPERWRRWLARDGVPTDAGYPAPTLRADGRNGARLYRANIPRRVLAPHGRPTRPGSGSRPGPGPGPGPGGTPEPMPPHAPVQVIVPDRDRYISPSYYDAAEQLAPGLVRRTISGPHWVIRTDPALVARWIAQFARDSA